MSQVKHPLPAGMAAGIVIGFLLMVGMESAKVLGVWFTDPIRWPLLSSGLVALLMLLTAFALLRGWSGAVGWAEFWLWIYAVGQIGMCVSLVVLQGFQESIPAMIQAVFHTSLAGVMILLIRRPAVRRALAVMGDVN